MRGVSAAGLALALALGASLAAADVEIDPSVRPGPAL